MAEQQEQKSNQVEIYNADRICPSFLYMLQQGGRRIKIFEWVLQPVVLPCSWITQLKTLGNVTCEADRNVFAINLGGKVAVIFVFFYGS